MTFTINNLLIVVCFFFFLLSAFLAHLFKSANIFFKIILFFFILGAFVSLESTNRIEVTISAILGFVVVYFESFLNFFYLLKTWLENLFIGFFDMIRRILRFIFLPIANLFTAFYNFLSRLFKWNRVFIPLGEPMPKKEPSKPYRSEHKPRKHWQRKDDASRKQETPDPRQSSRRNKGYRSSDKYSKPSSHSTRPNSTSSADRQREDSIKQAKDQVKKAREQQTKKKDDQDSNSGDQRSHKQILGLSDNFTLSELTKAYKSGLSRYHPDKYSHMSETFQNEAKNEFIKVKNAYNSLIKNFN